MNSVAPLIQACTPSNAAKITLKMPKTRGKYVFRVEKWS
jgi:hypothetical protein